MAIAETPGCRYDGLAQVGGAPASLLSKCSVRSERVPVCRQRTMADPRRSECGQPFGSADSSSAAPLIHQVGLPLVADELLCCALDACSMLTSTEC